MVALVLLLLFGALRYDNFLGTFNMLTVLRYNSMFALTAPGHVLRHHDRRHRSVGRHHGGLASVVSAMLSPMG